MITKIVLLFTLGGVALTSWAAGTLTIFPTKLEAEKGIKQAIIQKSKKKESNNPKFIHIVEGFVNIIAVDAVNNCKENNGLVRCDISLSTKQPIKANVYKNTQSVSFTSKDGYWQVAQMGDEE